MLRCCVAWVVDVGVWRGLGCGCWGVGWSGLWMLRCWVGWVVDVGVWCGVGWVVDVGVWGGAVVLGWVGGCGAVRKKRENVHYIFSKALYPSLSPTIYRRD